MFFYLSKIFWALAQPAHLILLLLLVAVVLLWWRPAFGRVFTSILVLLAFIASTVPIGEYFLRDIENQYAIPVLPEKIDGIMMLGGVIWLEGTQAKNQIQIGDKSERLINFIMLARKYPNAKLVFTGGSGNLMNQTAREADVMKQLWTDLGQDPTRVIWERDSRNTYENIVASKALAIPQPGENWVLITSALHMPRSVAILDQQDWPVIPYPVDYITTDAPLWQREFSVTTNLWYLASAMREIIGIWAYRLTGRAV
jgi:uncharacterized SAM-binding protein YcdF (DUF218 family)